MKNILLLLFTVFGFVCLGQSNKSKVVEYMPKASTVEHWSKLNSPSEKKSCCEFGNRTLTGDSLYKKSEYDKLYINIIYVENDTIYFGRNNGSGIVNGIGQIIYQDKPTIIYKQKIK